MKIEWELARRYGYTPITDYWERLCGLSEKDSEKEILAIFTQCMQDYKCFTEFVMVLNHLSWFYNEHYDYVLSDFYAEEYYKYKEWAYDYLKGEELTYFLRTLD